MSSVVSVNFTISSSRCAHLSPSRSRPKIEIVSVVHPSLNQTYLSVLFSKGSLPQIAPPQLLNSNHEVADFLKYCLIKQKKERQTDVPFFACSIKYLYTL